MDIPFKQAACYTESRFGMDILGICCHIMAGTYNGSINWFLNPNSNASAHYLISKSGEVTQMVKDEDFAWSNGASWSHGVPYNPRGIGLDVSRLAKIVNDQQPNNPNMYLISLEFEGYAGEDLTVEQYNRGGELIHYLANKYNFPKDRYHIIGHYEIDYIDRSNCGSGFSIDKLIECSPAPPADPIKVEGDRLTTDLKKRLKEKGWGKFFEDSQLDRIRTDSPLARRLFRLDPDMKEQDNMITTSEEGPMSESVLLKKENDKLTISLTELKQEYDTYKNDVEIRFNLFDEKYQKLEELNKNFMQVNETQGREIVALRSEVKDLNIKLDNVVKERDAYKFENDIWKGKAITGTIKPSEFPSKFMYYWKQLEAKWGKKFTYNATEAVAVGLTTILTYIASIIAGESMTQLISNYLPWFVPFFMVVRTTVISTLKDKNTANKILVHAIQLVNPNFDPFGLRQNAIEKAEIKSEEL